MPELDRQLPVELRVVRRIDDPHGALAEHVEHDVAPERVAPAQHGPPLSSRRRTRLGARVQLRGLTSNLDHDLREGSEVLALATTPPEGVHLASLGDP